MVQAVGQGIDIDSPTFLNADDIDPLRSERDPGRMNGHSILDSSKLRIFHTEFL
jgi:hypothetical protein